MARNRQAAGEKARRRREAYRMRRGAKRDERMGDARLRYVMQRQLEREDAWARMQRHGAVEDETRQVEVESACGYYDVVTVPFVPERHALSAVARTIPQLTPYATAVRIQRDWGGAVVGRDTVEVTRAGYEVRRVYQVGRTLYRVAVLVNRRLLRDAAWCAAPRATPLRALEYATASLDRAERAHRSRLYGAAHV